MTREEASIIIGNIPINGDGCYSISEYQQAKARAIEALEQQPCEDWYDVPSYEMTLEQARQAVRDLRKKLAEYLEQQPCEDAVSRQAVLDTLDKMDKALDTDRTVENYKELLTECYKVLPSVGKDINVTTTDAISRKDMLAIFRQSNSLSQAWDGFEKLPSVIPKEKTGMWKKIQSGDDMFPEIIVCSKCNNENSHLDFNEHAEPIGKVIIKSRYCPNCGARMEVEKNG